MKVGFVTAVLVTAAALASCSVEDGPVGQRSPTTTRATTTTDATTADDTTATMPVSAAVIEIGPARYDLEAVCAAGGAGEVEVALAGVDVNGLRVVGLVRAFVGEPYIGLQVGEGDDAVLFEPRLEGVLPFELEDGVLDFPEVDFVTELDLTTGEFVPAGLGSITVECNSFVRELPAVPFS